jgi:cellulose synthase/poly-beta-1,6-N-acetylglucosamine synthase-like glycosyltransferase
MVTPFSDQQIGIVTGPVRFPERNSRWVRLQRADLAHLLAAEWGAIGLGVPISAIGNNLAIRRSTYNDIGGYATLEPTIVEDCAILQRVTQAGRWKVAVAATDSTITTEPVTTIKAFLRQRARWSTGAFLVTRSQLVFLVAVFIHRIATVAATALACFGVLRDEWAFAAWGLWIGSDALAIWRYARITNQSLLVFFAPLVTLWQAIYQPISGLWALLFPGTISWKGQRGAIR